MDVSIRHTGIRCGGALRSMQVMRIIHIAGVILIQDMAMDIQTILVRLWHVTLVTKEVEIAWGTLEFQDQHSMEILGQERYIMAELDQLVEASIFLGHRAREHN